MLGLLCHQNTGRRHARGAPAMHGNARRGLSARTSYDRVALRRTTLVSELASVPSM